MSKFPPNVKVSQRMQVVDIFDVEITGILQEEETSEDYYAWTLTRGENAASLTEWLDAFEGKNVIVTIRLADSRDDGVKLHKKPMEADSE